MTVGVNPHSCSKFLAKVRTEKKMSKVLITSSYFEILQVISLFGEEFTPLNKPGPSLDGLHSITGNTKFSQSFIMLWADKNLTVARA